MFSAGETLQSTALLLPSSPGETRFTSSEISVTVMNHSSIVHRAISGQQEGVHATLQTASVSTGFHMGTFP